MKNIDNPINNWFDFISEKTTNYTDQIIPLFDLSILIEEIFDHKDCPFSGLQITINHFSIIFQTEILGDLSNNPILREDPFDKSDANYKIEYELKKKNTSSSVWYENYVKFLTSVWLPEYRKHGALDFKQDKLRMLLPKALSEMSNRSPLGVYCIFADLDKFGVINKQIGDDAGDIAIQVVLGCFEAIAMKERAICTLNGGDEYVLFIENKGDSSLLYTLDTLRKKISEPEYGENKLKVGITFGICKLDNWSDVSKIQDTVKKADLAFKKTNSEGNLDKNRGVVSFYSEKEHAEKDISNLTIPILIKLTISLIRSRQNSELVFSNSLLNFISSVTWSFFKDTPNDESKFHEYIEDYIKWLDITFTETVNEFEIIGYEHHNLFISKTLFTLAIAHGILKSCNSISLSLKNNESNGVILVSNDTGNVIWGDELKDAGIPKTYNIGASIEGGSTKNHLSNCVLISLGSYQGLSISDNILLPENLFVDSIIVDGRPIAGGGLPDFWQAAMAQLIDIVSSHNINRIIVYGDKDGAPNITNLLACKSTLTTDDVAEQSASYRPQTKECMELLTKEGVVKFCQSSNEVITALYDSIIDFKSYAVKDDAHKKSKAFLQRPLHFPESKLPLIHGMKCSTATIAYPAILEQLRSNTDDEINTYDNAEKRLKEVIGFKLVLDTPSKESIPDYWINSENELKEYADSVLINKEGLIGRKLTENGQFESFLKHLVNYCNLNKKDKTSTRRAILIVSNQFNSDDMSPLGLVSIWVTPRLSKSDF